MKLYLKAILTLFFAAIPLKKFSQDISNQYYEENHNINLYAFIGEKISVTEFDPNENTEHFKIDPQTNDTIWWNSRIMDEAFHAKYKIIQPIFNDLQIDTITFEAYDHYGRPSFENYEYVILYISRSKNESSYFHQKYQFDVVKKNRKGLWKGQKDKSIKRLFLQRKKGIFKSRGIFDE